MSAPPYICWQDDDVWVGRLQGFPGFLARAESLAGLEENLISPYWDLTAGGIPSGGTPSWKTDPPYGRSGQEKRGSMSTGTSPVPASAACSSAGILP
jgi:hypothetical protein